MAQKKDKKSKYSDWQLMRMRDCLHAYLHYGDGASRVNYNWKDVSEAIEEYTGENVPHERLRQFVKGTAIKAEGVNTGIRKYGEMAESRLDAIVRFLLDEDLKLADAEELDIKEGDFQGPLQLLSYIRTYDNEKRNSFPKKLAGRFQATWLNSTYICSEITLEEPLDSGLVRAFETIEHFDPSLTNETDQLSFAERHEKRLSYHRYEGWAVLTAEDHLMLFMKSENRNRNHHYINLGIDEGIRCDAPLDRIVLMIHEFPMIFRNADKAASVFKRYCIDEAQFKIRSYVRSQSHD